jgi:opacity protein-like surface antigen
MRKPRFIGIVAIVALFVTSVHAADLPAASSSPPIPNLAEVPNWTGPYIGLDFGMRYDAVHANVTSATVGTPPAAIALPTDTTSDDFNIALHGGGYGGWNYQITADYVVGAEVDFGWSNETANLHGSAYPGNLFLALPAFLSELHPKTSSGSPRLGTAAQCCGWADSSPPRRCSM